MKTGQKALTKKQSDILHFIKKYISRYNFPPTIIEICKEFDLASTNGVSQVLNALQKKGYLSRVVKGASRGLIINHDEDDYIKNDTQRGIKEIIIIGKGNSENPMSHFISPVGSITIDTRFFESDTSNLFAHIVEDDGMSREGIFRGDTVIAEQINNYNDASIVIAIVNDMRIVRKLKKNNDKLELTALTRGFPKIELKKDDKTIFILGKLIGLIKKI